MKSTLLIILAFASLTLSASHQRCIDLVYDHIPGTNKYVFTIFEQLEPGVPLPNHTIYSNSLLGDFNANLIADLPLSNSNCATQRRLHIYQSDTVDLGAIPVAGYTFAYSWCCRQAGLSNINDGPNNGFYVEIKMFPEPGQTFASSSPRFIIPPTEQQIPVAPFLLEQPAIDPDGDFLVYDLADAKKGTFSSNSSVTYNTAIGASGATPLGSAYPVTINQATGTYQAANALLGFYVFNLEVRSYKNGALTSIIHRDILIGGAASLPPSPSISIANFSTNSGSLNFNNGSYSVTIKAGDSLSFNVLSTAPDSLNLLAAGYILGTGINTTGYCTSNCATFLPSPNLTGKLTASGKFAFHSDTTHLNGKDTNTYRLIFISAGQAGVCDLWQYANLTVDVTLVKNTIGIEEKSRANLKIYPNPATDVLTVKHGQQTEIELSIYTVHGQEIGTYSIPAFEGIINVSELPQGIYLLRGENLPAQYFVKE